MLLSLAWRNVLRNRRRSAITISAIAIGLAAMTFLWGMIDGINRQMVENTTRYFAGDAQVHLKGYHDDPTFDLAMENAAGVLDAVRGHSGVRSASLRLEGKALASRGDKSRGVKLSGVIPEAESRVTVLLGAVIDGRALSDGDKGVLIGEKLAEALGVRAGEDLVFVGQAYDGSVASGRFPVRGVFRSKIDELDGFVAVSTLGTAREFYAAPEGATSVVLRLREAARLESVRRDLVGRLGQSYEVLGWPRLLPMVAVSTRFHEVVSSVVLLVFLVVIAAAVANPVLMAVLERTREFGIMLALGMSRSRLLGLVFLETMLLGAAGLVLGNAIGLAVTGYFAVGGMNLSVFEAGLRTMPGLSDVVYTVVLPERSLMLSALVFAIACMMAVYPAAKAAGIEPVEAIRGVRAGGQGAARGERWSIHLPVFLLIATRNLLRNPRRTAIMVAGTGFGIVGYVFVLGFFDGFFDRTIENSTRYITGHVQIERPGFRREFAPEASIGNPEALLERVRSIPGIVAAAPRIQAQALASTAAKSEGVMLMGIAPVAERGVTFIDRTIVEGRALGAGADREAMIGRELAEKLRLKLGEKIVIMAQSATGELGTAAFRVSGIFATESASFDGTFVFVTLSAAQALLDLGSRVSTINLRVDDRSRTARTLEELRRRLESRDLAFAPWQELLPQLQEMVRFNRVVTDVLLAILLLVVATAIMNTVFMAVTERTRELGVMMALGATPSAVLRMVVYETLALLLVAALAGYGAGIALVAYLGAAGMDLSGFFQGYSTIPGLTGVVYPQIMLDSVIPPGVALIVVGALISLYPASRAAKLDPSRAIRHV
jgi:ABC-type lipoprotein release transport system permease subunit